jgi:hypothetical protein
VVMSAAFALAVGAVVAWPAASPEPAPEPEAPLIRRVLRPYGQDLLVRADPLTLRRVSRPLGVPRDAFGHAFSPDGAMLALGSSHGPAVSLTDLRLWRPLGSVELRGRGAARPLAWPEPSGLIVALSLPFPRHGIAVVDPTTGRTLVRRSWRGEGIAQAAGAFGVVTVVSPPSRIGPARLVHVDPAGALRSVPLSRIRAGYARPQRRTGVSRSQVPGLAVDPARGRAYVVAVRAPLVAEVGLASGRVAYHRLRGRAPGDRHAAAVAAKGGRFEAAHRVARWLGDGLIAISGDDRSARPGRRTRVAPFGVRLIDTTRWTTSRLDARPTSIALAGDRVLATGRRGVGWDHQGKRDAGLQVFRRRRLYVRFPGEDVSVYGVHGRRAYVWVRRTRALHTLDVGSGRSLYVRRTPPRRLPSLLVPEGPDAG